MHRDPRTIYILPPQLRQSCYMCSDEHDGLSELCYYCFSEERKIAIHCTTSKRYGLPGDLTLELWMQVVKRFEWRCAYCLKGHYEVLEHFIPTALGGGTTLNNCIPACYSCNARKQRKHPDVVTRIPKEAIERVRVYLSSQNS
jgi:5-methylcytosine-specific restriction endonuclease McrA